MVGVSDEPVIKDEFEEYEESFFPKGGGGKGETWGSKGRKIKKSKEAREGQRENAKSRHGVGEKPVEVEIGEVMEYLRRNPEMKERYEEWVKRWINRVEEMRIDEEREVGRWEQYTSSVKAGGGGRQTSNNARAARHLLTGIRARDEQGRDGASNERRVIEKLERRLRRHLSNWRVVMGVGEGRKVSLEEWERALGSKIGE